MAAGILQIDGVVPDIGISVQACRLSRVGVTDQKASGGWAVVSCLQVLVSAQVIYVIPAALVRAPEDVNGSLSWGIFAFYHSLHLNAKLRKCREIS